MVNVEVVVTDRDGNRVTGLGPEDFRLRVDGEPVAVDYFNEVVGGEIQPSGGGAAPRSVPGVEAGRVGTSYLIFVDDQFAIARDRNQVIAALADELAFLGPDDRAAVVAFDGDTVDMLSSWTDSPRVLRRALSDAQARRSFGLNRLGELRMHETSPRVGPASRGVGGFADLDPEDRHFALQVANQVERGVAAAAATLRGFAAPPGRKVMLLLAGGWPFSPAAYAVGTTTVLPPVDVPDGPEILRPLVDTANLLGYTVYPVDVPGLGTAAGTDATRAGTPSDSPGDGARARERNLEDTLAYVAGRTGGRALVNAQRLAPLERVAADTRSFYWLGFTPARRRDDRRHEIRVEVTRPGLEVRARSDYRDLSRGAERQMALESALLFGDAATEGSLAVQVGEVQRGRGRTIRVPVQIAIPGDLVTAVPLGGDGGWAVRLELRIAALDEQRRRSDVPVVPLGLRLEREPRAGSAIVYPTTLELRRARQVVVVSVTDVASGRSATARVTIAP